MKKFFRRLIIYGLLISILLAIVVVGTGLYIGYKETDTLLIPERTPPTERERALSEKPEEAGLTLEPFIATTHEGTPIRACLVRPCSEEKRGTAIHQRRMKKLLEERGKLPLILRGDSRGTVILTHDFGGSMEDMFPMAEILTSAGFSCILYDGRAHGERDEKIVTYGINEIHDIKALITAAQAHFPDLGLLSLYGEGVGGAISLEASDFLPEVRSVAANNAYTTLKDLIWDNLEHKHDGNKVEMYAYFTLIDLTTLLRTGSKSFNMAPISAATRIKIPTLIICTEKNNPFYLNAGKKLHDALASKEKAFYASLPFEDAIPFTDDEIMYAEIIEWLATHTHEPMPDIILPKAPEPRPIL